MCTQVDAVPCVRVVCGKKLMCGHGKGKKEKEKREDVKDSESGEAVIHIS